MINRLRVWHVQKYTSGGLHGGNFHLLPVKEKTVPLPYLSPFRRISDKNHRPILRKRSRYSLASSVSSPASGGRSLRLSRRFSSEDGRKRRIAKSVQFSPYNKVHLLSRTSDASLASEVSLASDASQTGEEARVIDFDQYEAN